MNKFTLNCPIDFEPMITKTKTTAGLDPDRWEEYTIKDLIPYLAYEGFYFNPNYTKKTILDRMKNLKEEEIEILSSCLEPVSNSDYMDKWSEVPGAGDSRLLLYGRNDSNRRIINFDSEVGEMEWLLRLIDENGIENGIKKKVIPDGRIIISNKNNNIILTFYPCCPCCYTILPQNWFMAADFYPISLLAPTTGGKTTLMYSWLINNFEIFNRLEKMGDGYMLTSSIFTP